MKPVSELPDDVRWIMSRRDLPQNHSKAKFSITKPDGNERQVLLSKRKRQVLEALMQGPIYCASPVRLSDNVLLLRNEHGIGIHTEFYEDDSGQEVTRFGVYSLIDAVKSVQDLEHCEVAA